MNAIDLHEPLWAQLQAWRQRLPHALLITGQRGLGKFELARAFAAGLLCESVKANGQACGSCLACGWFAQSNHPDFRLLQPDALREGDSEGEDGKKKASQQITIEQVRSLDDFFNVGTHRSGLRVIVVNPAEAMNRNAANALLKTLEEPAQSTLFLLVCNEPMRLLPTIRSRCQVVSVSLPPASRAITVLQGLGVADPEKWLALAGGTPMRAADLAQSGHASLLEQVGKRLSAGGRCDPLAAAAEIEKLLKDSKGRIGLRDVVEWAQKWMTDMVLAGDGLPVRYFLSQRATIAQLAGGAPVHQLLRYYRQLLRWRREAEQPLNVRLFLETVFMDYRACFRTD